MRAFYLPSVPDTSDSRYSQYQHRANAGTKLYEALKAQGHARSDIRIALEHIRYLDFTEQTDSWIAAGASPRPANAPQPIHFDVRSRAHAKEAFRVLLHRLRVPHTLADHGTITPIFSNNLGFSFRLTSEGASKTFLAALLDGRLLAEIPSDPSVVARSLYSPNRQLHNMLSLQAPVYLELALQPRPITDVGSKRLSLFCRNDDSSPPNYIYLPPSIQEPFLVPRIDGAALLRGDRSIQLINPSSKQVVAVVPPTLGDSPSAKIHFASNVTPSPFARFKPFASYLRGKSNEEPPPLTIAINRLEKSHAYTQQRVILGNQMSVPAWYPLGKLEVHALTTQNGQRYVGLYAPGVSPTVNPPLNAFTLDPSHAAWHPTPIDELWAFPSKTTETLARTLKEVLSANVSISRNSWLNLHTIAQQSPLITYSLLFSKTNPLCIYKEPSVKKAMELPGWSGFEANLEAALLAQQAQSVPFVAYLLAKSRQERDPTVLRALQLFVDRSWPSIDDPVLHLTRLATRAPTQLATAVAHIHGSPRAPFAALAGSSDVRAVLLSLPRTPPDTRAWTASAFNALSPRN
jgi:hypothetical protein